MKLTEAEWDALCRAVAFYEAEIEDSEPRVAAALDRAFRKVRTAARR